ncbi:MAG: rRNA maturation RNase YbeY [Acidimicrobiales bacterium]
MAIEVFVADEQSSAEVDVAKWGSLAERILTARGVAGNVELNVLYVDEGAIASLNKRFLGHEGTTDVLSFPIEDDLSWTRPRPGSHVATGPGRQAFEDGEEDPSPSGSGAPGDAPRMLGDVVICPSVAARNAPEHAGSYEDEMALLLVHGILHLLGMDHEDDAEAEEMEALERELLVCHHRGSVES